VDGPLPVPLASTVPVRTSCSRRRSGNEIARRFGAQAVAVDPDRSAVPVSATLVRERPLEHLHFLAPPVRAWVQEQARRGVELR
jgi:hypothetical protein